MFSQIFFSMPHFKKLCYVFIILKIISLYAIPLHNGRILTSRELLQMSEGDNYLDQIIEEQESTTHSIDFNCPNINKAKKDSGRLIAEFRVEKTWPTISMDELDSYKYGKSQLRFKETESRRTILTNKMLQMWPNAIIPFEISQEFNRFHLIAIEHALAQFHQQTCIRFIPRTDESNYIVIGSKTTGCWSSIDHQSGRQELNLESPVCFLQENIILQQLMHVLGYFPHGHKVPHRNVEDFVNIPYQDINQRNIRPSTGQIESSSNSRINPYQIYSSIYKYPHPKQERTFHSSATRSTSILGFVSYFN